MAMTQARAIQNLEKHYQGIGETVDYLKQQLGAVAGATTTNGTTRRKSAGSAGGNAGGGTRRRGRRPANETQ